MAIDIKDQPRKSYMDYDITDSGYDMKEPYIPPKRGVGAAEILMFIMVVGLSLPIIAWFARTLAELFA